MLYFFELSQAVGVADDLSPHTMTRYLQQVTESDVPVQQNDGNLLLISRNSCDFVISALCQCWHGVPPVVDVVRWSNSCMLCN